MVSSVLSAGLTTVYQHLTAFAGLESFWTNFDSIFGTEYNLAVAQLLRSQWQSQDFSLFPQIEVVSSEVLGSAKGAYAISTNRIYLSDQFVSVASQQSLEAVILEEFGHFVDAQVNATDTAGDEGEFFSAIVRGVSLSAAELGRIKAEDDHANIVIDNHSIQIEQATLSANNLQLDDYPIKQWTKLLGTSGFYDYANALTTGNDGAIYVSGVTAGNLDGQTYNGGLNAFITKHNSDGTTVWAKVLGTSGTDHAYALTTGNDGAIYVSGVTNGNLDGQTNSGSDDVFITKYNPDGTKVWAKVLGTSNNDSSTALTTGNDGAIYVSGYTYGNLDGQTYSGGNGDAFITKYNPDGTKVWTKLLGTSSDDWANALTTGNDGAIYVSGVTAGNLDGQTYSGGGDAFITKYNPDGTKVWTKLLGTSGYDSATALTTGNDGAIYVSGVTRGNLDGQTNSGGNGDAFITKYNPDGTKVWTKLLGTSGYDSATALTTGNDGAIYVSGATDGNLDGQTNSGGYDAFVTKYYPDGTKVWTKLLGTSSKDQANALTTGNDGAIYVSGYTEGNLDGQTYGGGSHGFITKYQDVSTVTITLAVAPASVTEDGTPNLVYTFTRTGSTTNALTVNYSIAGTADATDYTGATPGTGKTITFVAGSATATLTIDPTADALVEPDETVILTLASGTDYTIGTTNSITGTILNDDTTNQAPTDLALSNNTIAENQTIGTTIGTFTSTDPDTGNTFTYSLVTGTGDTDNALFAITGNQLQSNGIFDFETKNSYSIRVKTTDQGGLSYEKQLTIGITNVDEQRSLFLTPQQDIFINEGLDDTVTGTFANLQQNDNINGGAGIDTLILSGGTSTDSLEIDASNSSNQLNIAGTTIANFERFDLSGFLGTISFSGYAGNNWIKSGAGNDDLTGGSCSKPVEKSNNK